jgi:hypothetical protein
VSQSDTRTGDFPKNAASPPKVLFIELNLVFHQERAKLVPERFLRMVPALILDVLEGCRNA